MSQRRKLRIGSACGRETNGGHKANGGHEPNGEHEADGGAERNDTSDGEGGEGDGGDGYGELEAQPAGPPKQTVSHNPQPNIE